MFCFVLVVLLSLSIAISQLADKCKRLTQANAILEKACPRFGRKSSDPAPERRGIMTITWEQILAFCVRIRRWRSPRCCFLPFLRRWRSSIMPCPRAAAVLSACKLRLFCYDPVNRPLVWVMAAATLITWLCGLIIGKVRCKPVRILALLASVGFGIGILVYYKYWNLLADSLGGSLLSRRENLLAPLGLSYFYLLRP